VNPPVRLHVIGAFELLIGGDAVPVPANARRLLAYLAVTGPVQSRDTVAGRLWPRPGQMQARAFLRTALWRIRQLPAVVVQTDRATISLDQTVRTDLAESTALARDLCEQAPDRLAGAAAELFADDILPGWDEEWLELDRERHRQLRVHALEALSRQLTASGRYAAAIDVAYRAIGADALRESAYAVLIHAHLAEGNRAEASRQLGVYRRLLADELGLTPSRRLESLMQQPVGA
jgi:DNA-binding SARP family transcriptional activator